MIAIAKAMTDEEIKATADYFGSMPWTPWIKVVETETVPKTRISGGLFLALDGAEKEPLGKRIIEVPENTEASEMYRNPRSGFIAYAPPGSIKKGEALVPFGRQDCVRLLPRRGPEGPRPGSRYRGPVAELPGAADVRHAGGRAQGRLDAA